MSKKASGAQARSDSQLSFSDAGAQSGELGAGGNDLKQIQNLLFGAQAREIEANLQLLENRLNERMDRMSQAFDEQFERLGALMSGQLEKEQTERALGQEIVVESVDELRSSLTGALSDLSGRHQLARREMAEELQVSSGKLAAQMALQNQQLSSQFQQGQSELDESKLSKKAMAKLLNELAAGV